MSKIAKPYLYPTLNMDMNSTVKFTACEGISRIKDMGDKNERQDPRNSDKQY